MTQADKQKLRANSPYNAAITREQFLFYEMRTTAKLHEQGLSDQEVVDRIAQDNLFQYPTGKSSRKMAWACLRRLSALGDKELVKAVAENPSSEAKQVCLYAMMRQYYLVWEFMTKVVGEKYRALDLSFGKRDVNAYFLRLREQDSWVATWSDSTVERVKNVLMKLLADNGYMDSIRSKTLNPVTPFPVLEEGIRRIHDEKSLPAFNRFD